MVGMHLKKKKTANFIREHTIVHFRAYNKKQLIGE